MPIDLTYATGSAVTVSTTPISLTGGTSTIQAKTDSGLFEVYLDASNVTDADLFEMRLHEKTVAAGSQIITAVGLLTGADDLRVVQLGILGAGWDVSLVKLSGTDRAFTWSVRRAS